MRKFQKLFFGLILSLVVCVSMSVAEEKEKKEEAMLEEIVVTATKTEREVKDVPASVTVITKEEIERQKPEDITDLFRRIPGVIVRDLGEHHMDEINIRGVGGPLGSRHVEVLVDGFPIRQGSGGWIDWRMIPIESIERVEVIKGPISSLYGSQAMGGVVNIITKKGKEPPETGLRAGGGSYGAQRYNVSTLGKLKNFDYAFNFTRTDIDGWRENNSKWDNAIYSKFGYKIDELSDIELAINWMNAQGGYPGFLTLDQYKTNARQTTQPWANYDIDYRFLTGLTYNRFFPKSKLTVKPYFKGTKVEFIDGPSLEKGESFPYGLEATYEIALPFLGREHTLLLGGMFEGMEEKGLGKMVDPATGVIGPIVRDVEIRQLTKAAFLQVEFRPTDKLTFIPGVRFDRVDFDTEDRLTDLTKETDISRFSPRFGMSYRVTEDLNLYANYGQGFKLPYPLFLFYNPDLKPEYATNYEVGARWSYKKKLNLQLSLYYIKMKDEIAMVGWPDFRNIGESSRKGVELEASLLLPKGFSLHGGWGYQEVKYEEYEIPGMPPFIPPISYKNKYVPNIPKHTLSVGIGYDHPSGFSANLTVNYVGKKYMDLANTWELDSYTVLNAKVRIPVWKKATLTIAADNLTDEKYCEIAFYDPFMYPQGAYSPIGGRRFFAGMEVRF